MARGVCAGSSTTPMSPYLQTNEQLSVRQTVELLNAPNLSKTSTGYETPCAGDVHLLQVSSKVDLNSRLVRACNAKWIHCGRRPMPSKQKTQIYKTYHRCAALMMARSCYVLGDVDETTTHYVLVQYTQEEAARSVSVDNIGLRRRANLPCHCKI